MNTSTQRDGKAGGFIEKSNTRSSRNSLTMFWISQMSSVETCPRYGVQRGFIERCSL